jgi:Fe(3+) dicitrate transport protein
MRIFIFFLFSVITAQAQVDLHGRVVNRANEPVSAASVYIKQVNLYGLTDDSGAFTIKSLQQGSYLLEVSHVSFQKKEISLVHPSANQLSIVLEAAVKELDSVAVMSNFYGIKGVGQLAHIENAAIHAGKKNEVLHLEKLNANLALNNTREVFARVPGINIWENDGSGVQVGVSSRGLSPNRSWEFNVRQNGYDISSDVFGYPEAYYTPPMEAVERIDILRGASSLSYGPQLGGMLNFRIKTAPKDKAFEVESRQTRGSYNLFNSYNSVGGTKGKVSYFGFVHHRSANGWRENSRYIINTGYASAEYRPGEKTVLGLNMTAMDYTMQQPGGLTDSLFALNPRGSLRNRNWINVRWYTPALYLNHTFSEKLQLDVRTFGLYGERNSVGFVSPVTNKDNNSYRDVLRDTYMNIGAETRLLYNYTLFKDKKSTLVTGNRVYRGQTLRAQGLGTDGADASFAFLNPQDLENSDYIFTTKNASFFAENLLTITRRLAFTQGIRYELIRMEADGYYKSGGAKYEETLSRNRSFPLFGFGAEYHLFMNTELYANWSQGYRAFHFNDLRILNPSLVIDSNLSDSDGHNADFGIRGQIKKILQFDVSMFNLKYNNRVGTLSKTNEQGENYQLRTNVADSRHMGVESFVEADLVKVINQKSSYSFTVFSSYAYIDARYVDTELPALDGKRVELAPRDILRAGFTFSKGYFSSSFTYSYVGKQFSDAANTVFTANGNNGLIPAYQVLDFSAAYKRQRYLLAAGVNNLANEIYFTRRAGGYPGPGIVPAEPRTFYITAGIKL